MTSPAPAEEVRMVYVCLELQIPFFFRLSEVAASHLLLKGESLGQVEENIYGPALKRRYLSDFLTDLNKSNAIFSLETVSSFHLLGPLSQEVCFKVKTASEVGRR